MNQPLHALFAAFLLLLTAGAGASSGKTVQLTDDLLNQGTIAGREVVSLSAENIKNLVGR